MGGTSPFFHPMYRYISTPQITIPDLSLFIFASQLNAKSSLMKTALLSIFFASVLGISTFVFSEQPAASTQTAVEAISSEEINWLSIEEALVLQQQQPKKMFIDLYTDWCGWCKVMDQKTFTDKEVIEYIQNNFYAVKFDAEQREDVIIGDRTFKYVAAGRRGIHELAYALLDGRPSYPAFVTLNEEMKKMGVINGFLEPTVFLPRLKKQVSAK